MTVKNNKAVNFDILTMGRSLISPLIFWGVAVGGAALSGYPGVVCLTPLAWLLALLVGRYCTLYSTGKNPAGEAALAGGIMGLIFGLIAVGLSAATMPIEADEQANARILALIVICGGMIAGVVIAFIGGKLYRRHRSPTSPV